MQETRRMSFRGEQQRKRRDVRLTVILRQNLKNESQGLLLVSIRDVETDEVTFEDAAESVR